MAKHKPALKVLTPIPIETRTEAARELRDASKLATSAMRAFIR